MAGAGCRVFPTPFLLGDRPLRVLAGRAKDFRTKPETKMEQVVDFSESRFHFLHC